MFLLKLLLGLVLVVLLGYFFLQALAGTLNVGINTNNSNLNGKEVAVSIYNGDVSSLLKDDNPSNDPEPAETHKAIVGQRTTFNLHDFGSHTLMATLANSEDGSATCEPYVVAAWGLDVDTLYIN